MTARDRPRSGSNEPESSPGKPDRGPEISVVANAGIPTFILAGPIDRELARRSDTLLQLATFEHDGPIAVNVSEVDTVNGALLGLLLRASRRLAWRNRELLILCGDPETARRLRIAGLDELATLVESVCCRHE